MMSKKTLIKEYKMGTDVEKYRTPYHELSFFPSVSLPDVLCGPTVFIWR